MSRVLYFFLLSVLIVSCIESEPLSTDENTGVIQCVLTNDIIQYAKLNSIADNGDVTSLAEAYAKVQIIEKYSVDTVYVDSNGKVVVLDTTFTNTYIFTKTEDDMWQAQFTPVESAFYELEAIIGNDTLSSTIHYQNNFDISDILYQSMVNTPMSRYSVIVPECKKTCTVWIYGQDYNPDINDFETTNLIYTDHLYVDSFNITNIQKKNVEEFIKSKELPKPPQYEEYFLPLYWGIKYGTKDSEDYYMHNKYLRLSMPEGRTPVSPYTVTECVENGFFLIANFQPQYYNSAHKKAHYVFLEVSPEYDKYLLDVYARNDKIFTAIDVLYRADYEKIYTNITGGKGIFAWANKTISYYHVPKFDFLP